MKVRVFALTTLALAGLLLASVACSAGPAPRTVRQSAVPSSPSAPSNGAAREQAPQAASAATPAPSAAGPATVVSSLVAPAAPAQAADLSAPAAPAAAPAAAAPQAPAAAVAAPPVAAAAPAAAAPAAPAPAGAGVTVDVHATNVAFMLSQPSAPAGTVTFVVHNTGTTIHELVVLKTSLSDGSIPTDPAHPAQVLESGAVGRVTNIAPGATGTLTLSLAAGSYVLICNEPAHYLIGMHSAFTVTGGAAMVQHLDGAAA